MISNNVLLLSLVMIGASVLFSGICWDILRYPPPGNSFIIKSSRLMAGFRAMDSKRISLFAGLDPLAQHLAGDEIMHKMTEKLPLVLDLNSTKVLHSVTMRALAFDDRVRNYSTHNHQVVVLGAGMDTRPYRLDLPNTHWFEVDTDEVISLKEQILASISPQTAGLTPEARVKSLARVALDWREDLKDLVPSLQTHGFDCAKATTFLLEGVAMHLTVGEVRALFHALPATPGSRAVLSVVSFIRRLASDNSAVQLLLAQLTNSRTLETAQPWLNDRVSLLVGQAFGRWTVVGDLNLADDARDRFGVKLPRSVAKNLPITQRSAEHILDLALN